MLNDTEIALETDAYFASLRDKEYLDDLAWQVEKEINETRDLIAQIRFVTNCIKRDGI